MKVESNGQIPFLDVLCKKKQTRIATTVYRKPTSTYRLIDMDSAHTNAHKFSGIQSMVKRAFLICSEEYLEAELQLLNCICKADGYPKRILDQEIKRERSKKEQPAQSNGRNEDRVNKKLLVISYDESLLKLMQPVKRMLGLKLITKPTNKLNQILVHPKDQLSKEQKCNIIYKIPFSDGKSYIGETCRQLSKRIN